MSTKPPEENKRKSEEKPNTEKKLNENLKFFLSVSIPAFIAVIGWYYGNFLTSERERKNKLRDIKIEYVIEAYNNIANAVNRPYPTTYETHISILNKAFAAIQLFGTERQIELTHNYIMAAVNRQIVNADTLLIDLRNHLREELNQPEEYSKLYFIRSDDPIEKYNDSTIKASKAFQLFEEFLQKRAEQRSLPR